MINAIRIRLTGLLESTGLDWIPAILNPKSCFPSSARPTPTQRHEIYVHLEDADSETLEYLVDLLKDRLQEEDARRANTEGKANQTIGFSAIALSFLVAFGDILPSKTAHGSLATTFVTVIYGFIAIAFLISVFLAHKALSVATYQKLDTNGLIVLTKEGIVPLKLELVASLQHSVDFNHAVVSDKLTYLMGAQLWLRNVIVLLIMHILVLSVSLIVGTP